MAECWVKLGRVAFLAGTLGFSTAWGQSAKLLEQVRLHAPGARAQADAELASCRKNACDALDRLSLLSGFLALSDGDAEGALDRLSATPAPKGLEAWHAWYRGQAAFYTRDYAAAAAQFEAALADAPASLEARLEARVGEALLAAGDPKKALKWLDAALKRRGSPELLHQRASARRQSGKKAEARKDLETLATRHPTHALGLLAFDELKDSRGRPPKFTLGERMQRTQAFHDAGRTSLAETELAGIEKARLARTAAEKSQLAYLKALVLFGKGQEEAAEGLLDKVIKGPSSLAAEAAWTRARRALKKSDRERAHALMLDVAKSWPKERVADDALYLAGWLDLQESRFDAAVEVFGLFEKQFPRSSRLDEALWFKSLAQLRKSDFAGAQATLKGLMAKFPRSSLVPQAKYWAARATQLSGAKGEAVAPEYIALIETFPGSFYALMSQARLRELGQKPPAPFPSKPAALEAEVPTSLEKAVLLAKAGLFRDANEEVDTQLARVRGAEQALTFGHALQRLGEYGPAYALAARYLWGAAYGEKKAEAIALLYPRAFRTAVEREAKANGIPAYLVWAIMRRESAFRPDVYSSANARGLMQIIPPTAEQIARKLGDVPPPPDALYAPEVNIRFGAWYLSKLSERFGHPALTAAAYNAGPNAVVGWMKDAGKLPLDLFVELIPYKETRGYVKQVVTDYHLYQQLYADAGAPGPVLNLPVPKDGVSF
ncbi:MAG: transglycosylase SLT domain-containing protein [Myxococcaceae bacterium]